MRFRIGLGKATVLGVLVSTNAYWAMGSNDVKRIRPVPIGTTIEVQSDDRRFGVYVPTRFGGVLSITTTAGEIVQIKGPDGRDRANGEEVGTDAHGWYTFRVTGAEGAFSVGTSFVQVGRSARKPWNFYYWPTKSDAIHEPWAGGNARVDTTQAYGDDIMVATPGGSIAPGQDIVRAGPNGLLETPVAPGDDSTWFPNLYDDMHFHGADGTVYATPSPLLKYDQIFRTRARSWEAANSQNQDISRWPGHCLGGAVASILLDEPTPAPGSGMSRDELKALWAELGEDPRNHRIGDSCINIPLGPPRPGFDETDRFAPLVHKMLETHIRGRRQTLLANLRAFPPGGTREEVWNHGIGQYTARYSAIPGRGEREVRIDLQLEANSGSSIDGQDDKPRAIQYAYVVVYGFDGTIDETQASLCDWIELGGEAMFCPLNVMEVLDTHWQGYNPYVTESNVRALDLSNGGNPGRLPASPPQFHAVRSYEAGSAPPPTSTASLTPAPGETRSSPLPATAVAGAPRPRRGGLFRFFGSR